MNKLTSRPQLSRFGQVLGRILLYLAYAALAADEEGLSARVRKRTERSGRPPGGNVVSDISAHTLVEGAHCLYRGGELEVEAAEQDAAIRTGKGDDLMALRLHRLGIATLAAEDGQRSGRLIAGTTAVLRRNLLRPWGGVAFPALAIHAARARRPLNVRGGLPATRVGCSGGLDGT